MWSYDVDIYEHTFAELAENGKLCCNEPIKLSKQEIAGFHEHGFSVFPSDDPQYESSDVVPCFVAWSEPFHDRLPFRAADALNSYIKGTRDFIPEEFNFAQRLYAIATRANKNKK